MLFAGGAFAAALGEAAGVTAAIEKDVLVVRGDAAGNDLTLTADPSGSIQLSGGGSTAINGQPDVVITGVSRGIRIALGDGDDRLTVSGLIPPGNFRADTGRGEDQVLFRSAGVQAQLRISGKSDGKSIELDSSAVGGRTALATGSQDDAVTLTDSTFGGRVTVRTGRGNDSVRQESTFNGGVRVKDGPGQDAVSITKAFDFRDGEQGWAAGFADYPPGAQGVDASGRPVSPDVEDYYKLQSGSQPLPAELGVDGAGFLMSGFNHSDDLFMFLKRQLGQQDGISSGVAYQVAFDITVASNAPTGCIGAGGPPGEGVVLKAGAGPVEPVVHLNLSEDSFLRMNVDHGRGEHLFTSNVGDIANGIPCEQASDPPEYVSLERHHVHMALVKADRHGQLWLLVGTDSGFEGPTTLYYQRIAVTLMPADSSG